MKVGDITMNYEVVGEGDPLLLIHGLGSSLRDWEFQLAELSAHYRVITVDLRGHGDTDKPPGPYSMPQFADDLINLMNAFRVGTAHVVGISLGGMVGLQLAVSHPKRVRTLVVVNALPEFRIRGPRSLLQVLARFLIVRLYGMERMGQVLAKRLFIKPEQEEQRQVFVRRWAENDPKAYMSAMRAIPGWSVAKELDKIECATLFIAADNDYTSVAEKERYVSRIPGARLKVIADSRHATPIEQPTAFNQTILEFLSDHTTHAR